MVSALLSPCPSLDLSRFLFAVFVLRIQHFLSPCAYTYGISFPAGSAISILFLVYISPSLYPGCQIISPVLDHFLFCGVHFQFSGSTQNSAHNSPLSFPTQGQGTDRQLQPPQTSVVVKGGRGHHLRKSAKGRQQWLRPWRCQGEAATAVDLIKSPGSTRGNTCVTPRSKSRCSSGSTSIAPSQAPHGGSSCCGSVPYLPTLSQSRSRFGFRTEGTSPTHHNLLLPPTTMPSPCFPQLSLSPYRCRDKQRKESSRLQAVNRKLTAMNKLLMEENERLQKQVSQLVHENAHMRQQLQNVSFQVQCWPCCLHNHVMLVLKVLSSYRTI